MLELELGPSPSSSCGVASVPHSFSSVIKTVVVVQFLSQQPGRDCVVVTRAEQERCSNIPAPGLGADNKDNISISTYISAQLKKIPEGEAMADEGFCDKASTNPSSPESVQTVTEEF